MKKYSNLSNVQFRGIDKLGKAFYTCDQSGENLYESDLETLNEKMRSFQSVNRAKTLDEFCKEKNININKLRRVYLNSEEYESMNIFEFAESFLERIQ